MKKLLPITLIILIFIIAAGCGDDYKTPSDFKDNVAWLDAKSALPVFPFGTNPIYICFYSKQSEPCTAMMDNIFSRPEIIKYMNTNFTSIAVIPEDIDSVQFLGRLLSRAELLRALKVEGLPSHYFFDKAGKLVGARTGYIKLYEFKQLLKYMAEGYVAKYDFGTFLSMPDSKVDTVYGKF
ncbi:MAG TPA: thioredoxin family protein [candidate division Zixibacteria bacterium]|nr:thioredoxin family protein [candidate division Zixibacteria bacterium]